MQQFVSVMCTAVAEAVLDRCMETNAESEEDPKKVEVEFNYEFLDGQPNFSAKYHPLALMVSYFEGNHTYNPVRRALAL